MRLRVAALVALALVARAGDDVNKKIELPRELQQLVDLARSAAPEIFADSMVRLIEAGRVPQKEAQIELLEEAFAVAAGATEPVRLTAFPTTPPDTREMYRGRAGELGFDALSLQSRILRELLTVNPARARELFSAVRMPVLDPRPCEDPFVADTSAYFDLAGAIAQSAFSTAEKQKEAHVEFLAAILAGIRSPNQLLAMAQALEGVALNSSEWALLASSFSQKLTTISPDYRAFSMSFDALHGEVATIQAVAGIDLGDALKKYAVNQLTAARCQPDIYMDTAGLGLSAAEIKPAARNGTIQTSEAYFSGGQGSQIRDKFTHLQSLKQSPDFRAAFADFLRDFQQWTPSGSSADVLHQKATVLAALLELLPAGEDRDKVVGICAAMLASSPAQRDAPAEWTWQVRRLTEAAGGDAPKLMSGFRASGDAPLVLVSALEKKPS